MIEVIVPGEAPSTPNLREHHMARARRVKSQRAKVMAKVPAWGGGPVIFVRLTRVAARKLDDDNLAGALKGHRDAVAARLRVDDGSPLVAWEYQQAGGDPAVVVQIWAATEDVPARFAVIAGPKREKMRAPKPSTGRLGAAYVEAVGNSRAAEQRALKTRPMCSRCVTLVATVGELCFPCSVESTIANVLSGGAQ